MGEFYTHFLTESEKEGKSKNSESKYEFKTIFDIHPSYIDTNLTLSILKATFLIGMGITLAVCMYFLSHNVYLSLGLAITFIIVFILIFHESFFQLAKLFRPLEFNPFKELVFWMIKDENETLFYTNKVDSLTVGLQIFEIEIQPETVHATMRYFINIFQVLETKTSFSYQVVHRPTGDTIFITVFRSVSGWLNESKIKFLHDQLKSVGSQVISGFSANFHHFQTKQYKGHELINAFRCVMFHKKIDERETYDTEENSLMVGSKQHNLVKGVFTLGLNTFFIILFIMLGVPPFSILPLMIIIGFAQFFLYLRDFIFYFIKNNIFGYENVVIIQPFHDIQFLTSKKNPQIYYAYIRSHEITGIQIYNVTEVIDPPYCSFSKFLSGVIAHDLSFTYTVISTPVHYLEFVKQAQDYLKDNVKYKLSREVTREIDEKKWLGRRAGMWKATILISTSYSVPIRDITTDAIRKIEEELPTKADTISKVFHINANSYTLTPLSKMKLRSGVICEFLKNTSLRYNGSYLAKVYFQGTTLLYIIYLADELKKGTQVQVAAEFNTPTNLKNEVVFGKTINTEISKLEIEAGLLLRQLRSFLITCGTNERREFLAMKIVAELIKMNLPSVVFDISGNWGKLLTYFKGTRYASDILYFKLGKTFNLDPIHSEMVPNDPDNLHYLQYMYDAYQFTIKANKYIMNKFRSFVIQHQGLDIKAMKVEFNNRPSFEKDSNGDSLLSYLEYFDAEDLAFFYDATQSEEKRTKAHEFITKPHTIIVDISEYPDYTRQCFYVFVILSKFIHYIYHNTRFYSKFLFIPHIDIIFQEKFLDANGEYSKINKFFLPLLQKNFGFICLCNNIHYLHSNVFNFFHNIVTFRGTNQQDISVLANHMNLNELHGTGYYNARRKETYQIPYLKNLINNRALMKRDDIYQSFPITIDGEDISQLPSMEYHDIVKHMGSQGYDIRYSEHRILAQAKPTLFENNFREYVIFLDEIMTFFETIKTVEKVGGLFKKKILKILMDILGPAISLKFGQDRTMMRNIRNQIFGIMIDHKYLIPSHPRTAGGGEQMATSYAVGPQYDLALADYYESKHTSRIDVAIISKETDSVKDFAKTVVSQKKEQKLKYALDKSLGTDVRRELFYMHKALSNQDFLNFHKYAKQFITRFLARMYRTYYGSQNAITRENIEDLISLLSDLRNFPYTLEALKDLIYKSENVHIDGKLLESNLNKLYHAFRDFYSNLKDYASVEGI
ncbi:MAG: hypothetical protein ACFFBH_10670 [Promethearchaeota archaeon]